VVPTFSLPRPTLSTCPLFQAPDFKYAVKTNVLTGKFIDEVFHVVGRVRSRNPREIYWQHLGGLSPLLRTAVLEAPRSLWWRQEKTAFALGQHHARDAAVSCSRRTAVKQRKEPTCRRSPVFLIQIFSPAIYKLH